MTIDAGLARHLAPMRSEVHFDGRVVRCFIDRPKNAYALIERAVARNSKAKPLSVNRG